MAILSRKSTPATINQATVISNTSGESVGLQNGIFNLTYYESILQDTIPVSYTHLRAHETVLDLVCRLLLEKK